MSTDHTETNNVTLLRDIYGQLERGESHDFGPFFDALADDVLLETSVTELHGKQALINYFAVASELMDFQPFERPLEYFAAGSRVVQLGAETFRVKATGATHSAEWAWVFDLHEGKITRILAIQDLSGVAELVAEAGTRAQALADAPSR